MRLQLVVLGALVLAAQSAAAGTIPIAEMGVQVTVPDAWKPQASGRAVTFADPTGNAAITFAPIAGTAEALKKARDTLKVQLDKLMTEYAFEGDMETKTVNSLSMVMGTARGKLRQGNIPVKMAVVLVFTPKKQVLFTFALVAAPKFDALKGDIWGIVRSIRPLPAAKP
jgi:hypothetical protein